MARNKQPKGQYMETMEYLAGGRPGTPMLCIVRRNLRGLEKPYIWQAALLNIPARRLVIALRQPWMNFREGRNVLAEVLDKPVKKLSFSAVKGGRTYYPTPEEIEILTEPVSWVIKGV